MEAVGIIFAVIIIALFFRLVAGSFDGDRVEEYIKGRGWKLLDKSWDPFGPGWFGEKDSRIYRILYRDKEGSVHEAHVKTSMFSGVYLTQDRVIKDNKARNSAKGEDADLAEENRRLREHICRLEGRNRQR